MDFQYSPDYTSLSGWREEGPDHSPPPPNILFDSPSRDPEEGGMTSLGLPPLDFEQLPNFFSLPPCPPYKFAHFNDRDIPVKNPHDIADALLSLKHAVVHPEIRGSLTPLSPPPPPPPTSSMPHLGHSPYPPPPPPGHQSMSGYSIPSPGPHPYAHGHPYSHGYAPTQSLSYSVNHPSPVMQSSYGGGQHVLPPSHGQYPQYPDPCLSPTMQHSSQTANVPFPSMSVNVSMSMNVGMHPPNHHGPNPYSCGGSDSGQSQGWVLQPPSPPPTLPPPPPPLPPPPPPAPPSLPQYSSSPSSNLQATCGGYPGQFTHVSPDYRSVASDPRSMYYKPVSESFKESKFCQISHHHHHHHHHQHAFKRNRYPSDKSISMSSSLDGGLLKTNLCRTCGKTYARPSTLKTHMRTHSGEKPYKCNTCSKSFSQAANLTAHLRTHSGEKPFTCPVCERRFSQSSSVTTHMRTHSGERPYRCRMCKKAFSDSSTLTKHLRIHSGEKPYQCKLCLLRFSQSGNLNRHMRVHSNSV